MSSGSFATGIKNIGREILIVALAVGIVSIGLKGLERFSANSKSNSDPLVGTQVSLRDAEFDKAPVSLILVGSPSCVYCRQSTPFHAKLFAEAEERGVPFYAVVPNVGTAREYLQTIGLGDSNARPRADLKAGVSVTPTILAVDSKATVTRVWRGLVNEDTQAEIMNVLNKSARGRGHS
jgi:hypothetical protein